jgi:hypothetical protein
MPLYIIALPGIPIILFVIKTLLTVLGNVFKSYKKGVLSNSAKALQQLALSITLFGMAIALSGPIYIIAALSMVPILFVLIVFLSIFKVISDRWLAKGVKQGARNLKNIATTIALFGIAIALIGPLYIAGAIFILPIVATLGLFVGIMFLLSKVDKDVKKGAYTLWMIAAAIVLFGAALYLWNKMAPSWENILQTISIIGAFSVIMYLVGTRSQEMLKASGALILGAVSLVILGYALKIMLNSVDHDWENIAMVGAIIAGYGAALVAIGALSSLVNKGAIALTIGSIAIIGLATGLKIFSSADITWKDVGILGATIAMIGVEFGLIGIPVVAGFIALGAAAMIVASASLVTIGLGLKSFKNSGWQTGDEKSLHSALSGIRNAFLGLNGDEGFVGTVSAIGKSTALAAAMAPISLMYLPAAISLIKIGKALNTFKQIGFTSQDADNMKYSVSAVPDAFIGSFKDISIKDLIAMRIGINSLSNAGNTLAGLAQGIQSWSNLTSPIWEYDETSGEMKIKGKVKLKNSDFKKVSSNMKLVISAIAEPFAEVGKMEMGLSPNDSFYSSIFGNNFVSTGIESLSGIGNIMSGLAQGVQDWVNLTVTEYGIVQGTNGPELKAISRKKLSNTEISKASLNLASVATVVAKVFSDIGADKWGASIDPDDIKDGIESLMGIGNVSKGLASSVQLFSKMEFVSYKVAKNSQTGTMELVPDKVNIITDSILTKAGKNLKSVALVVAKVFSEIGADKRHDVIDPDDIEDAVKSLSGIGDVISALALSVQSFVKMEFVQNEVKLIDGIPTLVPKDVITLTPEDLVKAQSNITDVAKGTAVALSITGKYINDNKKNIKSSVDYMPKISDAIISLAEGILESNKILDNISDIDKVSGNLSNFILNIMKPFINKDIKNELINLGIFTNNVSIIANSATDIEHIAKSFDSISKSMGTFKNELNSLDLEVLKETKGLFQAMSVVAEAGTIGDLLDKFGGTIENTFEKLAELLSKFADNVSESGSQTAHTIANMSMPVKQNVAVPTNTNTSDSEAAKELTSGIREMIGSLESIESSLRGTLKTKQSMF